MSEIIPVRKYIEGAQPVLDANGRLAITKYKPVESGINVYTPSIPKRLIITPTMIDDMICNPVSVIQYIFKIDLDAFQKNRLAISWWTPRVMDSSGFNSAKTFGMWLLGVTRCMVISNHWILIAYPSFETMQKTYWKYFKYYASRSPIFCAQIGQISVAGLDGKKQEISKAQVKGAGCWTCDFRNGSQVMAPAVGFMQNARSMASWRCNDLYVDEHTKAERMKAEGGSTGIDDQLVQRASRDCFNQQHPFWMNHQFFCATAEDTMHPSYARYKSFQKEVNKGNPWFALISYSMKNTSWLPMGKYSENGGKSFRDVIRNEMVFQDLKRNSANNRSHFREEGLGIWSVNGKGFYTGELMEGCQNIGKERKLLTITSRHEDECANDPKRMEHVYYFMGGDPAPAGTKNAADGTLVIGRAESRVPHPTKSLTDWRFDFVWAYLIRGAATGVWAGIIQRKQQNFGGLAGICLDHGGGGQWIAAELEKSKVIIRDKEVKVTPIATLDAEGRLVNANFILTLFWTGDDGLSSIWEDVHVLKGLDNLIDLGHTEFQSAMEQGVIGFPPGPREVPQDIWRTWSEERRMATVGLLRARQQLVRITFQTHDDGTTFYTNHQARRFAARGKKDFGYACMFCFARFLQWLKRFDEESMATEDNEPKSWGGRTARSYASRNHD